MGYRGANEAGLGALQDMSRDRARLRVAGIGRMMRRMRDDIKENAGPIVLGVTFLAGLAWLLLGCGGAENPGFGTEPAESVSTSGAGATWAAEPCALLPPGTYCPGSASAWGPPDAATLVAYWCSAGASPGPACSYVAGSGADGGSGQWCCP